VDRAALDAALHLGIECGGWCPRGRRAEDGTIPAQYPLCETPSAEHAQRTEWNVRDSDGTLILAAGPLSGGTALTQSLCTRLGRPCFVADLNDAPSVSSVVEWIEFNRIGVLNVAGPRASQQPAIYDRAFDFLCRLFAR
jgi:hypothetical protein